VSGIEALVASWRRDLRARNLAPKTVKTYGESADQLAAHLAAVVITASADSSDAWPPAGPLACVDALG
jgi:hypothetical protein